MSTVDEKKEAKEDVAEKPVLEISPFSRTFKLNFTEKDVLFFETDKKYMDLENGTLTFDIIKSKSTNFFTVLFMKKWIFTLNVEKNYDTGYEVLKLSETVAININSMAFVKVHSDDRKLRYVFGLKYLGESISGIINKSPFLLAGFSRVSFD